ncbi:gfo/Idh/MocA family oxidoreductase [Halobacteriales archaeon QS_1_68_17]|nr:MAG: gfo/Idh/MocA family oxidoreductase [Halobacteriales archaeon QS_1_68_17]
MRFGVVGCGTIAQVMHVPYLAELPSVDLAALVDPAGGRVETLADRYGVPGRYRMVDDLVADRDDLDAVVVCPPPHTHADVVETTLGAGLHTLVEKPLAARPSDAERMVDAAERSDAVAMVAYMKRYDPAYERAREELFGLDGIDLVTAYDVDPDHGRIIDEVYDLVPGDPPASIIEESVAKRRRDIESAVGTDDDALVDAYDFQIEHVCHDVNVLRGLFGDVERIRHVDVLADGRYLTARLDYEGGVPCVLESGDSDRKWFEEYVRVDGPNGVVRVDFSNPFIRNSPTELQVKRGIEDLADTTYTPAYDEPFKRELERFVACVEGDREVRTTFAEARADVELIADLFRTARNADRFGNY